LSFTFWRAIYSFVPTLSFKDAVLLELFLPDLRVSTDVVFIQRAGTLVPFLVTYALRIIRPFPSHLQSLSFLHLGEVLFLNECFVSAILYFLKDKFSNSYL